MGASDRKKRPWKFEGFKEEEGTCLITLTVPRRLGFGLGIYSRGLKLDLGQLCHAALASIIKGKRIPWAWFDEILASEKAGGQKTETQEDGGKPVDGPVDPVVTVDQPPAPQATPAAGGGEGAPKYSPKTEAAIARRKAG
jgi:hypothetical protein